MVNFQKMDLLRFLTANNVATGAQELNGASVISLVTHNARVLDEVSSGLARMVLGQFEMITGNQFTRFRSICTNIGFLY